MFLHKQIDVDWKVDESVEIGCLLRHRMVLDFPDLELRMKHCNTDDHSIRGKLVFKCNRLFFFDFKRTMKTVRSVSFASVASGPLMKSSSVSSSMKFIVGVVLSVIQQK